MAHIDVENEPFREASIKQEIFSLTADFTRKTANLVLMEQNIMTASYTDSQFFGENAMLSNNNRAGTCIAASDTYLAVVPRAQFEKYLRKHVHKRNKEM
jgi:CRP-like cAMP-binding protein